MNTKTIMSIALIGAATIGLTGCPTAPGNYAIWLVNASNDFTVTNIKVADSVYPENASEFPDDIPPNTTHVIDNVLMGDLEGVLAEIQLTGDNGDELLNLGDATVELPDPVASGDVYVIVVSGNNSLNFGAEYVPLDEESQGRLLAKGMLPPIQ